MKTIKIILVTVFVAALNFNVSAFSGNAGKDYSQNDGRKHKLLVELEGILFTACFSVDATLAEYNEYLTFAKEYPGIFNRAEEVSKIKVRRNRTTIEVITTFHKLWQIMFSKDNVVNFDTKYQFDGPVANNVFKRRLENLREKVRAIDEEQYNELYKAAKESSTRTAECLKNLEKLLGL